MTGGDQSTSLDLAAARPKTGPMSPERKSPSAARAPPARAPELHLGLVGGVERLVERLADADRRAVRDAVARNGITLALLEAAAGRAEASAKIHAHGLALYRRTAPRRSGGHRRRSVARVLARLGWPGQALLIARSGLWFPSGRTLRHRLYDLREMALYARRGGDPAVRPRALIEPAWYADRSASPASPHAPLVHYLVAGVHDGGAPHPLFDAQYYRTRNADALAVTRLDPLTHFLRRGAAEGRDPHPLFSLGQYLERCPEVAASGENALVHYLQVGWRLGVSPHPLFDVEWYRAQLSRDEVDEPPLVHYLTRGWCKGLSPHPLFDGTWYLDNNPDVASTGGEPLSHFIAAGGRKGRSPGPWFDCVHDAAVRGEALAADANPLMDYLAGGAWRVGEARPGFPTAAYLAVRPELVAQGRTPLDHWARLAGPPSAD